MFEWFCLGFFHNSLAMSRNIGWKNGWFGIGLVISKTSVSQFFNSSEIRFLDWAKQSLKPCFTSIQRHAMPFNADDHDTSTLMITPYLAKKVPILMDSHQYQPLSLSQEKHQTSLLDVRPVITNNPRALG